MKLTLALLLATTIHTYSGTGDTADSLPVAVESGSCPDQTEVVAKLKEIQAQVNSILAGLEKAGLAKVDPSVSPSIIPPAPLPVPAPVAVVPAPLPVPAVVVPPMNEILPIKSINKNDRVTVAYVNDIKFQLTKIANLKDQNRLFSLMTGSGNVTRPPIKLNALQAKKILEGFDAYVTSLISNRVDAAYR